MIFIFKHPNIYVSFNWTQKSNFETKFLKGQQAEGKITS